MTLEELAGHINAKYIYVGQPICVKELRKLLERLEDDLERQSQEIMKESVGDE